MTFQEFQDYIEEHILCGWKEDADVEIRETKKNNGITYQGLYIRASEEVIAPCLYLEEFYKDYQHGEDMDKIIEKIRYEYEGAMERAAFYELDATQYERIRDRIVFRLVNYERNRELLNNCPYILMHDLALTFRWIAHTDCIGISSALITYQQLQVWNVSVDEMILVARENTKRLFPPRIVNMDTLLDEMGKGTLNLGGQRTIFVMTNEQQVNGATVLVYEGVLKRFAEQIGEDLYVIPSSIHELILVPVSEFSDPEGLFTMVKEANQSITSPVDILSDSVYYYNRKKDRLSPVSRKDCE